MKHIPSCMSLAMATAILLMGVGASGQTSSSGIGDSRKNAIVRAIERAAPAVVSINVVQIERAPVMDPLFRDFFDLFNHGVPRYRVREREIQSVGSGFIFDRAGHIITNNHVIEGADAIASVTLPDGRVLDVEFVGRDAITDVAVLKANGTNLPYVPLGDSNDLMIGEWLIAIGNPFGLLMNDPQPSVSVGVVSANHRRMSPNVGEGERYYQDMIQTDAAINPGNSGGPLVNANGAVVGVNTMIFSQSGGSVGLGFAIPINRAKRVAEEIIQYGRRRNPWPGFKVDDVRSLDPTTLARLGVRAQNGCLVVNIRNDAPAYREGLRPGDVITGANGQVVRQASDVDFAIWGLFVGDTLSLDIDRNGRAMTVTFRIEELPPR